MILIFRFRGNALVKYGVFHRVVLIPFAEEILSIDKKAKNDADGEGITCAAGNQNSGDTPGHSKIIECSRF